MNVRPSILCPIDYSEASAGALRYAAAIAEHFVTRLIVLTVENPLLTTGMDLGTEAHWSRELSEREMAKFAVEAFSGTPSVEALCEYDVAVGKPAVEILRVARERSCDLIVMSSHGLTGPRKRVFGSTTERVLRETPIPVLVTPAADPGPIHLEDAPRLVRRIVVPVDLSSASQHQASVATGFAHALNVPIVLVHVIENVTSNLLARLSPPGLEAIRRSVAEHQLQALLQTLHARVRPDVLVLTGDPADEVARVVREQEGTVVVMGLHGSPPFGPRMGSITYRLLCLSPSVILALPPQAASSPDQHSASDRLAASAADQSHSPAATMSGVERRTL